MKHVGAYDVEMNKTLLQDRVMHKNQMKCKITLLSASDEYVDIPLAS